MKRKYSLLLFFVFTVFLSQAQSVMPDVVASSGEFFANSSGQIQWTLGEVMVETYQNSNNMLTQGFHQIYDVSTGITATDLSPIRVYPNPANDQIFIDLNNQEEEFTVSLMDATGKVLRTEQFHSNNTSVFSLKNYPAGMYLILINGTKIFNHSYRIIKTN